jgi:hypothetical protein
MSRWVVFVGMCFVGAVNSVAGFGKDNLASTLEERQERLADPGIS